MKILYPVIAVLFIAGLAGYLYFSTRPVLVTAYDYDDLCGSFALVRGDGHRGIPLKARPHALARTLTHLSAGRGILMCEEVDGWHGVVVMQESMECLDRDNRDTPRPYAGPCVWGWLGAEHVDLTTG